MKKGKRVKPVFPIEYRLLITPAYKEREKEIVTRLVLHTVKEFTNFRYEIVVEPKLTDHTLRLKIHGLRAPQVTLPGSGPATYETEYRNLNGQYSIVVSKLDREENSFDVAISDNRIIVEAAPEQRFIEIITSEEEW
jgi:hypothetical protein